MHQVPFIRVENLSRKYRGKFLCKLKSMKKSGKIKIPGELKFQSMLDDLYSKEWVVYSKATFKSAEYVIDYLGRYTHRIAISNHRLISIRDGVVSFRYKDYRDGNKQQIMSLEVMA
ncbi:MAG TPA: hypothetical protein DCS13_02705 [Candidatus Margulisbacteria bacterium]|nr:hypothetical protein [Candidatus Margulisiibacteriota bacterium]